MVAWRGPSEDVIGAVAFLGLEVGRVDPSTYMRYFLHVVSMKTILTSFQAMSVSLTIHPQGPDRQSAQTIYILLPI